MDSPLRLRLAPPRDDALAACPPALRLRTGATMSLRLQAGDRLTVDSGRLWLTQEGDLDDYFVGAGGQHLARRTARVVLECDSAVWARFRITRDERVPASGPG